uniref:F-box domain-containing protein n=2 Tax=Caenorhabditis japonica TaxID=281687 RepID=A0A8R1IMT4_CAEJA
MEADMLLKLPYHVQKKVVESLDPQDLFELSQTSEKMREMVKSIKIKAKFVVSFVESHAKVRVILMKNQRDFEFLFNQLPLDNKKIVTRVLNETVFEECIFLCDNKMHCKYENVNQGILIVFHYLSDLFQGYIETLAVDPETIELERFFGKCEGKIGETQILKINRVGNAISQEKLDFLIENIRVGSSFYLQSNPPDDYQNDKILGMDIIYIMSSHFLKRSHLINLNCISATFRNSLFTYSDIREFLCHWLHSNDDKLQYLEIQMVLNLEGIRQIRRGLQVVKMSKGNRDQYFPRVRFGENTGDHLDAKWIHLPPSSGPNQEFDIFRPSDQKLATARFSNNLFQLFVWHVPYPVGPIVERIRKMPKWRADQIREKLTANGLVVPEEG